MTKTKKILLFGVPILVGGYFIYRQIRGTKVYNKAKADEDCCKMDPPCDDCGYVPRPEDPLPNINQYKVTTLSTPLNVRESPSVSSAKIGSFPKGTIIWAGASETSGWMKVYMEDENLSEAMLAAGVHKFNFYGYVSADYLTEI